MQPAAHPILATVVQQRAEAAAMPRQRRWLATA